MQIRCFHVDFQIDASSDRVPYQRKVAFKSFKCHRFHPRWSLASAQSHWRARRREVVVEATTGLSPLLEYANAAVIFDSLLRLLFGVNTSPSAKAENQRNSNFLSWKLGRAMSRHELLPLACLSAPSLNKPADSQVRARSGLGCYRRHECQQNG